MWWLFWLVLGMVIGAVGLTVYCCLAISKDPADERSIF